MRKILPAFILLALVIASCNKEPQPLTKQEIKQKVDSITSIRIKESDELSRIDLDRRIKIEVKVKVDSIVNAKLVQKHKNDSVLHVHLQGKIKDIASQKNTLPK